MRRQYREKILSTVLAWAMILQVISPAIVSASTATEPAVSEPAVTVGGIADLLADPEELTLHVDEKNVETPNTLSLAVKRNVTQVKETLDLIDTDDVEQLSLHNEQATFILHNTKSLNDEEIKALETIGFEIKTSTQLAEEAAAVPQETPSVGTGEVPVTDGTVIDAPAERRDYGEAYDFLRIDLPGTVLKEIFTVLEIDRENPTAYDELRKRAIESADTLTEPEKKTLLILEKLSLETTPAVPEEEKAEQTYLSLHIQISETETSGGHEALSYNRTEEVAFTVGQYKATINSEEIALQKKAVEEKLALAETVPTEPVTEPPATEVPTTDAPATEPTATEAPVSEAAPETAASAETLVPTIPEEKPGTVLEVTGQEATGTADSPGKENLFSELRSDLLNNTLSEPASSLSLEKDQPLATGTAAETDAALSESPLTTAEATTLQESILTAMAETMLPESTTEPSLMRNNVPIVMQELPPNAEVQWDQIKYFFSGPFEADLTAIGNPVTDPNNPNKLTAYKWTVVATGSPSLENLGYKLNITAVEGSGFTGIDDFTVVNATVTTNAIAGNLGINDSVNVDFQTGAGGSRTFTFTTPVDTTPQEHYALDFSVLLLDKTEKPLGAQRAITQDGMTYDQVRERTPSASYVSNRTTIQGDYTATGARWIITDEVSTDDPGLLPLITRTVDGTQTVTSVKAAYYQVDKADGKMKLVGTQEYTTAPITIPEKGTYPTTAQPAGTIAVYEVITTFDPADTDRTLGGATLASLYKDIKIETNWQNVAADETIPAHTVKLIPDGDEAKAITVNIPEGTPGQTVFETTKRVPAFKLNAENVYVPIVYTAVQNLPADVTNADNSQKLYRQLSSYTNTVDHDFVYFNQVINTPAPTDPNATEPVPPTLGEVTIHKTDGATPAESLPGVTFTLSGVDPNGQPINPVTGVTDTAGNIKFQNLQPGTYILQETKAAPGYKIKTGTDSIVVADDGKVSWTNNNLIETQPPAPGEPTTTYEPAPWKSPTTYSNPSPSDENGYPYYMNTRDYAQVANPQDGMVDYYILLKPDQNQGGKTDRPTSFLIRGSNINIDLGSVTIYDVGNAPVQGAIDAMKNRTMHDYVKTLDPTSFTMSYPYSDEYTSGNVKIDMPSSRFNSYDANGNDVTTQYGWTFLIKVTAPIADTEKEATIYYDWLTMNDTFTDILVTELRIADSVTIDEMKTITPAPPAGVSSPTLAVTNVSYQEASLTATKVDQSGAFVPGATFALKDSAGRTLGLATSDDNGKITFPNVLAGNYTLEETSPAPNHLPAGTVYNIQVSDSRYITYQEVDANGNIVSSGGGYGITEAQYLLPASDGAVTVTTHGFVLDDKNGNGRWDSQNNESYDFNASFLIENGKIGQEIVIDFDDKLDFSRYVTEIPDLVAPDGSVVAQASMDYATKKLTYTLTDYVARHPAVIASVKIEGIIPDPYHAKTNGTYTFANAITGAVGGDGQPVTQNISVTADYGDYKHNSIDNARPWIANGIVDQYAIEQTDGTTKYYLRQVFYFNPNARTNWATTNTANRTVYFGYMTNIFKPTQTTVYRTTPVTGGNNTSYMPMSFAIVPGADPYDPGRNVDTGYTNLYSRQFTTTGSTSGGGVTVNYNPNTAYANGSSGPLSVVLPTTGAQGYGYVIENFYEVTDNEEFFTERKPDGSLYYKRFDSSYAFIGHAMEFVHNPSSASATGVDTPYSYWPLDIKIDNTKYTPGQLKLTKVNAQTNAPLPGAIFGLYDANGAEVDRQVSSSATGHEGEINFTGIAPGEYTLKEIAAPAGYATPPGTTWKVRVENDGKTVYYPILTGEAGRLTSSQLNVANTTDKYSPDPVNPNEGQTLTFATALTFTDIKAGQSFDVVLDGRVNPQGLVSPNNPPNIVDDTGNIIATGVYNGKTAEGNSYTYTVVADRGGPTTATLSIPYLAIDRIQNPEGSKYFSWSIAPATYGTTTDPASDSEYHTVHYAPFTKVGTSNYMTYGQRLLSYDPVTGNARYMIYLAPDLTTAPGDEYGPDKPTVVGLEGTTGVTITGAQVYKVKSADKQEFMPTIMPDFEIRPGMEDVTSTTYSCVTNQVTLPSFADSTNPALRDGYIVIVNADVSPTATNPQIGFDWWTKDSATDPRVDDVRSPIPTPASNGTMPPSTENFTVGNAPVTSIQFKKVDVDAAGIRTALPGVEFELRRFDGQSNVPFTPPKTATSAADGTFSFEGLGPGQYSIFEITPALDYPTPAEPVAFIKIDEKGEFYYIGTNANDFNPEVPPFPAGPYTITNTKGSGTLKINKLDMAATPVGGVYPGLAGATFELLGKPDSSGSIVKYTKTSGPDGTVEFTGLLEGYYFLKETSTVPGYALPQHRWLVHISKNANNEFTTEVWKTDGLVPIVPYVVHPTIQGLYARVNENGEYIRTYVPEGTTGTIGEVLGTAPDAVTGATIRVRETENWTTANPPTNVYNITEPNNPYLEVENVKGSFIVNKKDEAGQPLDGAEFTLTLTDTSGTVYTRVSQNGQAVFTGLPAGTYTLKETKAPAGYQVLTKTWTVEVATDGTVTVTDPDHTGTTIVEETFGPNEPLQTIAYSSGNYVDSGGKLDYRRDYSGLPAANVRSMINIDTAHSTFEQVVYIELVRNTYRLWLPEINLSIPTTGSAVTSIDSWSLGRASYGADLPADFQPGSSDAIRWISTNSTPGSTSVTATDPQQGWNSNDAMILVFNGSYNDLAENTGLNTSLTFDGNVYSETSYLTHILSQASIATNITMTPKTETTDPTAPTPGVGETGGVVSLDVANQPYETKLTLNKKNELGQALPFAKFQLTNRADTTKTKIETTDANGQIVFTGLSEGVYDLKEVSTPEGYLITRDEWVVVVDRIGRVTVVKKEFYNPTPTPPTPDPTNPDPQPDPPAPTRPAEDVGTRLTLLNPTIRSTHGGTGYPTVYPNRAGNLTFEFDLTIPDYVQAGDWFTVKHSANIDPNGIIKNITSYDKMKLTDSAGNTIATVNYDRAADTFTYTFTDYVDKYTNITTSLLAPYWIDRDAVKVNSYQDISFTMAGETLTKNYYVNYDDYRVVGAHFDLGSFITDYDKTTNTMKQYIYVSDNSSQYMNNGTLVIYDHWPGTNTSGDSAVSLKSGDTTVKVYRVNSDSTTDQPPSWGVASVLQGKNPLDLAANGIGLSYGTLEGGDAVTLDFGNKLNGSSYIVEIETAVTEQPTAQGSNVYTQAKLFAQTVDQYGYYYNHTGTWDNHIVIKDPTATGSGALTTEVTVKKVDAGTNTALAGAGFRLFNSDGSYDQELITTTGNEVRFGNLTEGTYFLRETKTPTDYRNPGLNWKVEVKKDALGDLTVVITPDDYVSEVQNLTITVKNFPVVVGDVVHEVFNLLNRIEFTKFGAGGQNLEGAKFKLMVRDTGGNYVDYVDSAGKIVTATSAADGTFAFTGIPAGEYGVFETEAPLGYVIPEGPVARFKVAQATGEITMLPGSATLITNEYYKNDLKITKVDADDPLVKLKGASFSIAKRKELLGVTTGYEVLKTAEGQDWIAVTDTVGEAIFQGLEDGVYKIKEVTPPTGYRQLSVDEDGYLTSGRKDAEGKPIGLFVRVNNRQVTIHTTEADAVAGTNPDPHFVDTVGITVENPKAMDIELRKVQEKEPTETAYTDIVTGILELKVYGPGGVEMTKTEGGTDNIFKYELGKKDAEGNPVPLILDIPNHWASGRYRIVEHKAPAGYIKTGYQYIIYVNWQAHTVELVNVRDAQGNPVSYLDHEFSLGNIVLYPKGAGTAADPINKLTIVNTRGEYPSTGGRGIRDYLIVGSSIMLFGLWKYRRNRKRENTS